MNILKGKLRKSYENMILNRGITLNKKGLIPNNLSYVVSLDGFEKKLPLKDLTYERYVAVFQSLNLKETEYFGAWIEHDLVYFDKSISINNLNDAIRLGLRNKQLAIYDFKGNKSIRLEV